MLVGDDAKADWTAFAQAHPTVLSSNCDPRFVNAVKFIRESPPKKQKVKVGRLVWESDSFTQAFDAGRLLILVCRIRNNLFHGGKFPEEPEEDVSRDRALLEAGLCVMQAFVDADHDVRTIFLEDLK